MNDTIEQIKNMIKEKYDLTEPPKYLQQKYAEDVASFVLEDFSLYSKVAEYFVTAESDEKFPNMLVIAYTIATIKLLKNLDTEDLVLENPNLLNSEDLGIDANKERKKALNIVQKYKRKPKPNLLVIRRSIKHEKSSKIAYKNRIKAMLKTANMMGISKNDIFIIEVDDFSGFYMPYLILYLLKLSKQIFPRQPVKVFFDEVSRLSRNYEAFVELSDFAFKNRVKLILNGSDATRGNLYISVLIQSIFATFELWQKQATFSKAVVEVIKFMKMKIDFDSLSPSARKLVLLSRFADEEEFLDKTLQKAAKLFDTFKNGVYVQKTKNGLKTRSNSLLRSAFEVICLITELSEAEAIEEYEINPYFLNETSN